MIYKIKLTFIIIFTWLTFLPVYASASVIDCSAYFSWNMVPGEDFKVKFTNESSGDFNTWMWDFGDGTTSGVFHPEHEFPGYGVYVVCLTVSDGVSCTDVYCDSIEITPHCIADFEFGSFPSDCMCQ